MVSILKRGQVKKVKFITGRSLKPGEKSKSGLYGIARKKDGWMLRISTYQQAAEMCRDNSREIVEVWLL